MKKQTAFCAAAALSLLLAACSSQPPQEEVSQALGIDVSGGQVLSASDDHGGFHGDGTTFVELQFSDDAVLEQIYRYNSVLRVPVLVITNGREIYAYLVGYDGEETRLLSRLPSYPELLTLTRRDCP